MTGSAKSMRTKAACTRCNVHKIKCSGDQPACRACIVSSNREKCVYPIRSKKITILNTELDEIKAQLKALKQQNKLLSEKLYGSTTSSVSESLPASVSASVSTSSSPAAAYNNANTIPVNISTNPSNSNATVLPALSEISDHHRNGMIRLSNPFGSTFVGELETQLIRKASYSLASTNSGFDANAGANLGANYTGNSHSTNTNANAHLGPLSPLGPISSMSHDTINTDNAPTNVSINTAAVPIPPVSPSSFYPDGLVKEHEREQKIRRLFLDDRMINMDRKPLQLPNKDYAFKLVHEVFRFFAREFGLFEISEFIDKIHAIYNDINSVDRTWISLFLITMATGEQYLNEASQRGKIPGMDFFLLAFKHFQEPLEEPTLDSVRTILLFAFYSQGLNRTNSVFAYTGLAISTAMTIGMHRKAPPGMPAKDYDNRRKVWWTALVMDGLWASRLGLPPHVHASEMDVELPDSNMFTDYGFDHKYLLANVQLCLCIDRVMKPMYNLSQRSAYYITNMMSDLQEVKQFYHSLPPELQSVDNIVDSRSVANLHLRYNQLTIQIVRPLFLYMLKNASQDSTKWPGAREPMQCCINAAKDNIKILEKLKSCHWFSNVGMLEAQCCFSALLVLVMATLNGIYSKELSVAVTLHTTMSEAGNITAMDNDRHLRELDGILKLVSKKDAANNNTNSASVISHQQPHSIMGMKDRTASPGINIFLSESGSTSASSVPPVPMYIGAPLSAPPVHSIHSVHPVHIPVSVPASSSIPSSMPPSISSSISSSVPPPDSVPSPDKRLNFVADLEPSDTGLHQYSPEMLYNLSVNFQNWEDGLELQPSW